jgi:hypothetical protein
MTLDVDQPEAAKCPSIPPSGPRGASGFPTQRGVDFHVDPSAGREEAGSRIEDIAARVGEHDHVVRRIGSGERGSLEDMKFVTEEPKRVDEGGLGVRHAGDPPQVRVRQEEPPVDTA